MRVKLVGWGGRQSEGRQVGRHKARQVWGFHKSISLQGLNCYWMLRNEYGCLVALALGC